jgi:hypothetical protein
MRTTMFGAALTGAALLAGCGGGGTAHDRSLPIRATLQHYFAAVAAQQPAAACRQLSEKSQERLGEFAKPLHAGGEGCEATMRTVLATPYGKQLARLAHAKVLRLAVHGNSATAAVDGVDRPLSLIRGGDGWRIDFTPSVEADKLPGGPKDADNGKDDG